jgi:hypothetical protein
MKKINDGGLAFPYDEIVGIPGMSLRQLYALGAMIGLLSGSWTSNHLIVDKAFKLADAMIEEGEK